MLNVTSGSPSQLRYITNGVIRAVGLNSVTADYFGDAILDQGIKGINCGLLI